MRKARGPVARTKVVHLHPVLRGKDETGQVIYTRCIDLRGLLLLMLGLLLVLAVIVGIFWLILPKHRALFVTCGLGLLALSCSGLLLEARMAVRGKHFIPKTDGFVVEQRGQQVFHQIGDVYAVIAQCRIRTEETRTSSYRSIQKTKEWKVQVRLQDGNSVCLFEGSSRNLAITMAQLIAADLGIPDRVKIADQLLPEVSEMDLL